MDFDIESTRNIIASLDYRPSHQPNTHALRLLLERAIDEIESLRTRNVALDAEKERYLARWQECDRAYFKAWGKREDRKAELSDFY